MTIATTTTKSGSTAISVTPTGGTTATFELYRQLASNKNQFTFTEDTSGALKATVTVSATPTSQKEVAGVTTFNPGTSTITSVDYYTDGAGVSYEIVRGYRWTFNEIKVPKATILGLIIKDLIFFASAAFSALVWDRKIS